MLSYFPGGIIADRFPVRKLLAFSLWTTALGGLYLSRIPNEIELSMLFAYWGCTTILLFWAALIRTTREWGGVLSQGRAFGFLDGGRGLIAAGAASLIVIVFSSALPVDSESASELQLKHALQLVIYVYTAITFIAGVIVWWLIPDNQDRQATISAHSLVNIKHVLGKSVIWLQAIIVVCAYCTYKGLDNYALYVNQVLGMNAVESAEFTSNAAFLRPIAAIAAGFLADRFITSKIVKYSFLVLIFSYTALFLLSPSLMVEKLIIANILVSFVGVYAIRGIYFALLEESNTSFNITGTAVGLISIIGFTPDIFFHAIAGRILDASPGLLGHQNFFLLLTILSITGMLATLFISRTKHINLTN